MAPVVDVLNQDKRIKSVVAVTAQHREMLDQVLSLFKIEPDYDLDIMTDKQSLTGITVRALEGLQDIIKKEKPELILVHGDTTTTFVGALAAYYNKTMIGHVEAGLRTHNKYSPYPEEMNRHLTGVLTDLHFAPTAHAARNLLQENVEKERIFITGNTVIDALLKTVKQEYRFNIPELNRVDFKNRQVLLLTAHRRENLGLPMKNIFEAVVEIVKTNREVEVVFPVHLNPRVRELAGEVLGGKDRIHLIEPLDYQPFANLMARSHLVLTDSGGIQEEAPGLGIPVLVLRNTTERPEAVKSGTVLKVGTDKETIINKTNTLLENRELYNEMSARVNPYGDGRAGERILRRILFEFDLIDNPGSEFINGEDEIEIQKGRRWTEPS